MIRPMIYEKKTDIETEIKRIEKLYKLGDYKSVEHLSRGLLISETLTDQEKKRIKRVLTGTHSGRVAIVPVILIFLLLLYLYVKYYT
jgi:hypothetical protein